MLEFFGSENGEYVNKAETSQFSTLFGEISDNLHPTWQMISSNIFVYSAFCQGNVLGTSNQGEYSPSCPGVSTIGIFRVSSSNAALQTQPSIICKLWYDDIREPKQGIPSVSRLGTPPNTVQLKEEDNFRPYIINCENQFPSKIPYGISFEDDGEKSAKNSVKDSGKDGVFENNSRDDVGFIHVQPLPHQLHQLRLGRDKTSHTNPNTVSSHGQTSFPLKSKRHLGVVACVAPSSSRPHSNISPQSLTEQVLLQNYLGVNNYIIYDSGDVSKNFLATIAERQLEIAHSASGSFNKAINDAKLSLNVLPWNIPVHLGRRILSSEDELELAQTDCYFRTVNRYSSKAFESSIFLQPEQILVPKKTEENVSLKSVPKLLQHTAAKALSEGNKVSSKLMVSVRKFCAEYPSDGDNSNIKHAINALAKSAYKSETSPELRVSLRYFTHGIEQSNEEVDIKPSVALIHDYGSCGDIIEDNDDASEKTDKSLVERGPDIDKSVGKYFSSVVMNKVEQQKIFQHKNEKRL